MSAYTVKDMQDISESVVGELRRAKSKCEKALDNLTTQISNVESAWKGLSAAAMVEAITAQKTRIQTVIGRIDNLIIETKSLTAAAAASWPSEETNSK